MFETVPFHCLKEERRAGDKAAEGIKERKKGVKDEGMTEVTPH
jgi:hypothetical protein